MLDSPDSDALETAEICAHQKVMSAVALLKPVQRGVTQHPFFQSASELHIAPGKTRVVYASIPEPLREVYSRYPDDVEFAFGRWTFLSESEIKERCESRYVDLAVSYAGMGHVWVLAAHKSGIHAGLVFEMIDGGANGYDREHNSRARQEADESVLNNKTLSQWLDDNRRNDNDPLYK